MVCWFSGFFWRQLREEETVASGDVDDYVAVAVADATLVFVDEFYS